MRDIGSPAMARECNPAGLREPISYAVLTLAIKGESVSMIEVAADLIAATVAPRAVNTLPGLKGAAQ